MSGEDPADDVRVNFDVESVGYLLGNSRATASGIAPFELDDSVDDLGVGSFWSRLVPGLGRVEAAIYSSSQRVTKSKEG